MPVTILAIGEALMDVVESPGQLVEHPGGSPLNIAFGLARLGRKVKLMTALGNDARGEAIIRHLEGAGVEIDPASVRAEPTSAAVAALDAEGAASYSFDIRWSVPEDWPLPAADIVHTGSLGAFVEPGGGSVSARLRKLPASTIITFDPNIRPSVCGGHGKAMERFTDIASVSAVVKLSDEDAAWLFPGTDIDQVMERILALGPVLVAVTKGPRGAVLASRTGRAEIPGRRAAVVDTIGAGDSFMAGLITSLASLLEEGTAPAGLDSAEPFTDALLKQMGEFAVECSAITVSRAGANPPFRAEVASLPI